MHSRATIKDFNPKSLWAVISMRCTDAEDPAIIPNTELILRLQFDDTETSGGTQLAFTDEMAREVLSFVNKVKDSVTILVCQCEAGISRSSGMAAALSVIFGQSNEKFFCGSGPNGRFLPNRLVYRKMLEAAGLSSTKE